MRHPAAATAMIALASASAVAAAEPATVQAVVVKAEPPPVQVLPDRRVYTIANDLQATTGSAADVLNQIPSVEVDPDGGLTLRGDSKVIVLIDGKPSPQVSGASGGAGLLQYPASEIDRIEVLTNPPAQYKADGGGVINIVTRKSHRQGPSGSVRMSLGDRRRFTSSAAGAWTQDRLTLSGTLSLRQDDKQRIVTSGLSVTDPASGALVASHERLAEQVRRLSPLMKLGVEYRPTDRLTVGVDLSHGETEGDRFFDQHDQTGGPGPPPTAVSDRHSDGHEWRTEGGQKLRVEQALRSSDETLTFDLHRSVVRERERYAYANRFTLPAAPDSHDHLNLSLDLVTTEFSADYVLPTGQDRTLRLGYDQQDDVNRYDNFGDTVDPSSGLAVVNPDITNHFRYRQTLNAAYATLAAPVLGWSAQAGLRLEQADIDIRLVTGDQRTSQSYVRAYPSLHLDRSLGETDRLNLSASRRVSRPDPEELNPFSDHQDIRNLRAGNPDLLPRDTAAFEAALVHEEKGLTWSATAYARFNRDAVTEITRALSDTVKLSTKVNLPKDRAAGLEFSAAGKLTPQLGYSLSGNAFWSEIEAGALVPGVSRSTEGLNLKASFDWRPTAADTFQLSATRSDRRLTPQGSVGAINLVNLGYRRQLSTDLSVVATLSDAFDGQTFRRYVHGAGFDSQYARQQLGRIAYVGFVHVIGAPKKQKAPSFDYDQ